ncbi:hypothetical protein AB0L65_26505 [Nonomuraea sp. NPDC052116]|uniref:hypothetical protein n=1 Tax=Nonomuraea sp. NPDC052116 TaxID=3155665 RepID=UPI00342EE4CC
MLALWEQFDGTTGVDQSATRGPAVGFSGQPDAIEAVASTRRRAGRARRATAADRQDLDLDGRRCRGCSPMDWSSSTTISPENHLHPIAHQNLQEQLGAPLHCGW